MQFPYQTVPYLQKRRITNCNNFDKMLEEQMLGQLTFNRKYMGLVSLRIFYDPENWYDQVKSILITIVQIPQNYMVLVDNLCDHANIKSYQS